jgi:serine/threonine protein kinase
MGTADYIAPEQTVNPQGADTRADVYSLRCSLYHLLTGRAPFPGASLARKLLAHQQIPPPSVRAARPDLPEGLEAIVRRMMVKQPADRYQTPALVAVALAPFCEQEALRLELDQFRLHEGAVAETLREAGPAGDAAEQDTPTLVEVPPPAAAADVSPTPAGASEGTDKRTSPRRGGNLLPVLVSDALPPEEPLRGWVLDRSGQQ